MLLVRNGRGETRELRDGCGPYLWTSKGLKRAWNASKEALVRMQPDFLVLHSGASSFTSGKPFRDLVAEVRAALPNARLWGGVGADARMEAWKRGEIPASAVIGPLVNAAKAAERAGFEAWVLDPEAQHKDEPGDMRSREEHEALARDLVDATAAGAPGLVLGVTTYDHLGHHGKWPLSGFFRLTGKVSLYLPQYYSANTTPERGELAARIKAAKNSQAKTQLPPDVSPDVPDDLDVVPLYQLHGVHLGELAEHFAQAPLCAGWCLPLIAEGGRADADGVRAFEAALLLRRAGGVREFQRAQGLVVDGMVGPKTLAALAINRG